MPYYLYKIGLDLENINNCYIGVTNNPKRRWNVHQNSKYHVGNFIRKYNLDFNQHMIIIAEGSAKDMFELEEKYRPVPGMGLNEAKGGHGGFTSYSTERSKKLSKALKGRHMKQEWIDKMKVTKQNNGGHKSNRNPNAKKWRLTSPKKDIIMVHGNLEFICNEHNILAATLRYYKGYPVPPLSNSKGGYRAKSAKSLDKRNNTIGWCLEEN